MVVVNGPSSATGLRGKASNGSPTTFVFCKTILFTGRRGRQHACAFVVKVVSSAGVPSSSSSFSGSSPLPGHLLVDAFPLRCPHHLLLRCRCCLLLTTSGVAAVHVRRCPHQLLCCRRARQSSRN